jgi:hypothetical protein
MATKKRKPAKRAAKRKSSKPRGKAGKQPGGAGKKAAARAPERSNASGSGLVYTDLLREALARRRG